MSNQAAVICASVILDRLDAVKQEVLDLQAKLDKYGYHTFNCPAYNGEKLCTCGWEEEIDMAYEENNEFDAPDIAEREFSDLLKSLKRLKGILESYGICESCGGITYMGICRRSKKCSCK
jgi:RNA polymerase-binding transcription factor DksA